MSEQMTPEQLQWVLDHNQQIRGGHRVQIGEAVKAWHADRTQLGDLLTALKAAAQFLDPEISRGPSVNGWQNTRELVDAAIAKAEAK